MLSHLVLCATTRKWTFCAAVLTLKSNVLVTIIPFRTAQESRKRWQNGRAWLRWFAGRMGNYCILLYECREHHWHTPGEGQIPPQYFVYLRIGFFCGYRVEEGQIQKIEVWGGKGCMYIKGRFKLIFPLFLTWLYRKLKFQIIIVDCVPNSRFFLLAKLRRWWSLRVKVDFLDTVIF
jgi:hypothetical protein